MANVFITGSADGLGQLAVEALINEGHEVVLHARNAERGREALKKIKGASKVLTADLSNMEETKILAEQVNSLGAFDAVIHNAGVYRASGKDIFAVNTLAPYILNFCRQHPGSIYIDVFNSKTETPGLYEFGNAFTGTGEPRQV
jgi:NAD(P)-dependent dehydrogenase (short-subunit alcohol dehydrogenase family)